MSAITFILVISFLIFFHELGHFLAARYFGVKVHVFSIGFGKSIYSKYFWGTNWQIAVLPLGGYVQMKGQNDKNPALVEDGDDSYTSKKPWQRIVILFAGPFANFLLAAIIYFAMAQMGTNTLAPVVGFVQENSVAQKAGILANDEIIRINDTEIKSWDDIGKIITSTDGALQFYIKRENNLIVKIINPQIQDSQNIFNEPIKKRMIGIAPANKIITLDLNFTQSLAYAYEKTIYASTMIFQGVQKLITGVIPSSEVGGIITIGKVISDASESSFMALLAVTALISVNLGVLNLLPIPALDGGHIIFNLYEMLTRRKPSEQVFVALTISGWVILLFLMLLGLYNDINRIFLNG